MRLSIKPIRIIFILLTTAINLSVQAQQIYLYQKNGFLGLKDYSTGAIICPAIYDEILPCQNNFDNKTLSKQPDTWVVQKNNLYGVINKSGKVIIPINCSEIHTNFLYGYIKYEKDRKMCLADSTGNVIFETTATEIIQYETFFYHYTNDHKIQLVDYTGRPIITIEVPYCRIRDVHPNGQLFVIQKDLLFDIRDLSGKSIAPEPNTYKNIFIEGEDIAYYSGNEIALYNNKGKMLMRDTCTRLMRLHENLFYICYNTNDSLHTALKDSLGKTIIAYPNSYHPYLLKDFFCLQNYDGIDYYLRVFSYNGREAFTNMFINNFEQYGNSYMLQSGDKYYLADPTGKIVKTFPFKIERTSREYPYVIAKDSLNSYLVNKYDGSIKMQHPQSDFVYECIDSNPENTFFLVRVRKDTLLGYIDVSGKEILPIKYNSVAIEEQLKAKLPNKRYTYFTYEGKPLCENKTFENLSVLIPDFVYVEYIENNGNREYTIYNKDFVKIYSAEEEPEVYKGYYLFVIDFKTEKYGLIGMNGETFISSVYNDMRILKTYYGQSNQFYLVEKDDFQGIVDLKNKMAIPLEYNYISCSHEDTLIACNKKNVYTLYGITPDHRIERLVNSFHSKIIPIKNNNSFIVMDDRKYGVVTRNRTLAPAKYDDIDTCQNLIALTEKNGTKFILLNHLGKQTGWYDSYEFSVLYDYRKKDKNGDVIVKKNNKYGIISNDLKPVLPVQYDKITYKGDNLYFVKEGKKTKAFYKGAFVDKYNADIHYLGSNTTYRMYLHEVGEFYLVNLDQTPQISEPYSDIDNLGDGYLLLNKNNRYGVWSVKANRFILDTVYQEIQSKNISTYNSSSTSWLFITKQNNLWGLASESNILIQPIYDTVEFVRSCKVGAENIYCRVRKGDQYGLYDRTGKAILPCAFISIKSSYDFFVELNNTYHYSYTEEQYSYQRSAIKQYQFIVQTNAGYGVVDTGQRYILPIQYDLIKECGGGYLLYKDGKVGYANAAGKTILPITYDKLQNVTFLNDNSFYFYSNKKWGVINSNSQILLEPVFDKGTTFKCIANVYVLNKNAFYGIADSLGKIILPARYASVEVYEHFCMVKNTDQKYAVFSLETNTFLTGFIYDSYDEKLSWPETYYILQQKTKNNTILLGLYVPQSNNTPLEPKYSKITTDNGNYQLYLPMQTTQQYQIYSRKHILSDIMDVK